MDELYDIKHRKVMRRGVCWNHHFCAYCGHELTKLNLKKGYMLQSQHFLVTLKSGIQVRKCWNDYFCGKRREKNK
jgi:hypothetical protein